MLMLMATRVGALWPLVTTQNFLLSCAAVMWNSFLLLFLSFLSSEQLIVLARTAVDPLHLLY